MSIEIYRLTGRGEELAHSYRFPRSPGWAVIHYLSRSGGSATKEQIYENVPSVSPSTLAKLAIRGIISSGRSVSV